MRPVLNKDAQLCLVTQPCHEARGDLRGCSSPSYPKLALSHSIDWQKILHIFTNTLKVQRLPYDLITQRSVLSSTIINIRAMEPNNMTICYWIFLETFSQRIMLKIT